MMNLIELIENHLSTQPRITSIGYALLHESLDELKKRQWIPVTERLPEKSGCYLVIVNDGLNDPTCELNSYRNGLWNVFDHEKVTHWMPLPLPELPK